jgi:16S rRNA processing protein RimM
MASKSSTSRALPGTVIVGRVRRPHGIRGEVVVEVLSDVPGRFEPGSRLAATGPGGETALVTVESCRPHRNVALLRFVEVADRDAAEALSGASLGVERRAVPPAPSGGYYHYELLGCRVSDRAAGELGEVVDLLSDGGGLLLLVEGRAGVLPLPFVESFLLAVDVAAGRIETDLPPGLVEACAAR